MKNFSLKKFLFFILISYISINATESIKIGMSLPLSGPSQTLGQSLLQGIEPTIAHINQSGGIHGRPLELVILDDAYIPENTIKNTIQFIKHHQVDLLFSYVGTPTTYQTTPLLFRYNMPLFFPLTGAHIFYSKTSQEKIVQSRPSYWNETEQMVHYFSKSGAQRFSVYFQKDAFGQSGRMGVIRALNDLGLPPVNDVSYPRGKTVTDAFTNDAKLLLQNDPEVIVCISSYQASAGIIKAIRSQSDIPIVTISFSDPIQLIELLENTPQATNNLYYSNILPNHGNHPLSYERITQLPFHPISFEGYLNTMRLYDILMNHSIPLLKNTSVINNHYVNNYDPPTIQKYTNEGWKNL